MNSVQRLNMHKQTLDEGDRYSTEHVCVAEKNLSATGHVAAETRLATRARVE